jgi:hypothetical protein
VLWLFKTKTFILKVVNNFYMHIVYQISFLLNFLCACVALFKPFVEVSSRRSVEQIPPKPLCVLNHSFIKSYLPLPRYNWTIDTGTLKAYSY